MDAQALVALNPRAVVDAAVVDEVVVVEAGAEAGTQRGVVRPVLGPFLLVQGRLLESNAKALHTTQDIPNVVRRLLLLHDRNIAFSSYAREAAYPVRPHENLISPLYQRLSSHFCARSSAPGFASIHRVSATLFFSILVKAQWN